MTRGTVRFDSESVVDLVASIYSGDARESWGTQLLTRLVRIAPKSRTAGFYEYKLSDSDGGSVMRVVSPLHVIGEDYVEHEWLAAMEHAPPPIIDRLFRQSQAGTASVQTGLGAAMLETPQWQAMWKPNIKDSLGITVHDTSGDGVVFFTGLTELMVLTPRERALLLKLATHLGAGHRLRRRFREQHIDRAEAVLSPNGKLLHAKEGAKNKYGELDDGRRRRNHALSTKRDAEKALEVWKGLVAGRWSLVDHFDTDGKRFLLALKNAPKVDRRADLTPRERRVCALAAMGHRDKEISYMLGLTGASITGALHRGFVKLGVTSRAELVTTWRRHSS